MPVLHGTASWPDVDSIESCTYTCSHGISPGVAILKMLPQPVFPLMFGDLTITDGEGTVVIPACRIDALKVNQDGSGTVWSLEIVDRRWRWRSLGYLNGSYNQLDIHAKLYPWTIRSPTELAILCLEEMGETGYDLSLPSGLAYPGPNFGLPIINTSGTNPPVNWEATPPAQALQALAEQYGCRVVYRLDTDTVYVGPIGIGGTLPPGSIHKQGPSIKSRETPDSVGVQGAPTRYQVRLELEAVGEEWDGSYRPIDLLSYAPLPPNAAGLTQKSAIVVANPSLGVINYITIDGIEITITDTDSSVATTHGLIAVAINVTQAAGFRKVRATSVLSLPPGILFPVVLVESVAVGVSFDLETAVSRSELYPVPAIYDTLVQASLPASNGTWVYCGPPEFPGDLSGEPGALPGSWSGVRATDRLTVHEARALARKSVFRVYRLTGRDVSGNGPIFVPGYGLLDR